jgi:hypothetical protein
MPYFRILPTIGSTNPPLLTFLLPLSALLLGVFLLGKRLPKGSCCMASPAGRPAQGSKTGPGELSARHGSPLQ